VLQALDLLVFDRFLVSTMSARSVLNGVERSLPSTLDLTSVRPRLPAASPAGHNEKLP